MSCLESIQDYPNPSESAQSSGPDKVLEYACSVMTDGLLLLEFRDAVHEGDGVRLLRCWRMLLLYFTFSGHTTYALEAFHLQAAVSVTASLRVTQDLLNSSALTPEDTGVSVQGDGKY